MQMNIWKWSMKNQQSRSMYFCCSWKISGKNVENVTIILQANLVSAFTINWRGSKQTLHRFCSLKSSKLCLSLNLSIRNAMWKNIWKWSMKNQQEPINVIYPSRDEFFSTGNFILKFISMCRKFGYLLLVSFKIVRFGNRTVRNI